ncbi:hypothetical protein Lser_V15G40330 [Lactuca serriola]
MGEGTQNIFLVSPEYMKVPDYKNSTLLNDIVLAKIQDVLRFEKHMQYSQFAIGSNICMTFIVAFCQAVSRKMNTGCNIVFD